MRLNVLLLSTAAFLSLGAGAYAQDRTPPDGGTTALVPQADIYRQLGAEPVAPLMEGRSVYTTDPATGERWTDRDRY